MQAHHRDARTTTTVHAKRERRYRTSTLRTPPPPSLLHARAPHSPHPHTHGEKATREVHLRRRPQLRVRRHRPRAEPRRAAARLPRVLRGRRVALRDFVRGLVRWSGCCCRCCVGGGCCGCGATGQRHCCHVRGWASSLGLAASLLRLMSVGDVRGRRAWQQHARAPAPLSQRRRAGGG